MVLITLGRYEAALAVHERAVEAYRSAQELEGLRRAAAALSRVYEETGDNPGGLARLLALRDAVEAVEPTPGLAAFYGALADLDDDLTAKLRTARRAEDLARAVGDRRLLAAAMEKRGTALMLQGRLKEAEAVLRETCTVAEAAGEITNLCFALDDLAWIHAAQGKIGPAQRQCALALEVAERRGNPFQITLVLFNSGRIAFYHEGDWRRARGQWEKAMALNRQVGPHGLSVDPALHLGRLYLAIGEREAGIGCLEEGIAMALPKRKLWAQRWGGWIRAEGEVLEGDAVAARDRLVPLLDRPGMGEEVGAALLALAHLALGAPDAAADCARRAVRRIGEIVRVNSPIWGHRVWLADALRVQALVTLRQGQAAEAQAILEEGLSLARGITYPYGEARLLQVYGQWHAEQGASE
jgi:tetratricopeptide (TPR) repeat protein